MCNVRDWNNWEMKFRWKLDQNTKKWKTEQETLFMEMATLSQGKQFKDVN